MDNLIYLSLVEDKSDDFSNLVTDLEVVQHSTPMLLITVNKQLDHHLKNTFGLSKVFDIGPMGWAIDIAQWLGESPWKITLLGELNCRAGKPLLVKSVTKEYKLITRPPIL